MASERRSQVERVNRKGNEMKFHQVTESDLLPVVEAIKAGRSGEPELDSVASQIRGLRNFEYIHLQAKCMASAGYRQSTRIERKSGSPTWVVA
jgi:hypothetical protein